jgi:endonuclease/exonuclease/phosphatase family metal-dependent hydrolase
MRIVSWNCHYGFDGKKPEAIKEYEADILVIPECRKIDMEGSGYDEKHSDWYGDHKEATDTLGNINKEKDLGIGVFWKDGITMEQLEEWKADLRHNSDFRYLVPYSVKSVDGKFEPFTLIAVWTKNVIKTEKNDCLDYVQKAHAAVDKYKTLGLMDGRTVLIGDFNSNVIWDKNYKEEKNHSALVKKLKEKGIIDCSGINGENKQSTFYYYTKTGENQVIDDYCFASVNIVAKLSVPGPDEWTQENGVKHWRGLSDHCPIIVDFRFLPFELAPDHEIIEVTIPDGLSAEEVVEYMAKHT